MGIITPAMAVVVDQMAWEKMVKPMSRISSGSIGRVCTPRPLRAARMIHSNALVLVSTSERVITPPK